MKRTLTYRKIIALLILLFSGIHSCFSQTLTLKISGIRNEKGVLQLTIYNNRESFKSEIPDILKNIEKYNLINGYLEVKLCDLTPGTWGIALIDDENCNGKLDYRIFIPREGFGFSNYLFKNNSKPDFKDFSFPIDSTDKEIEILLHYF